MNESRTIRVPSKWVLAGEHSVLRGCPAIVFPNDLNSISAEVFGTGALGGLQVEPMESRELVVTLLTRLLEFTFESGLETLPIPSLIRISSSIPIGAGLGSSAALSVMVVKILCGESLPLETLRALARRLEDHFHGESSGMDIIAVTSTGPTLYRRNQAPQSLALPEIFRFSLRDTGLRSATRDCVLKVKSHLRLVELDARMSEASELAQCALETANLAQLEQSMAMSLDVYRQWGLIPPSVENQIQELLTQGARAVRLTGAGGGGFLVVLEG